MLWSLGKINPKLPLEVKKDNGYQINGNVTLTDVQSVAFDNIDIRSEELDQTQNAKAFAARFTDEPANRWLSWKIIWRTATWFRQRNKLLNFKQAEN